MSTRTGHDSVSDECPRNKSVGVLVYRAAVLLLMSTIGWYLQGIKVEVQKLNNAVGKLDNAVSSPFGLPVRVNQTVQIRPIWDVPVRIVNDRPVSVKVSKE
jgi:hypothetical protein